MPIKAIFKAGSRKIVISNQLYQWDYGRELQIEAEDLPSIVEVHFATPEMKEAIVHTCSVGDDGKGIVSIPNPCVEQANPISVWVVQIGETSGKTLKEITIRVTPRTRPQPGATIPEEVGDRYTEAIDAMNEAVESVERTIANAVGTVEQVVTRHLEDGVIVPAKSDYATSAGSAKSAETANTAQSAEQDSAGRNLSSALVSETGGYTVLQSENTIPGGVVLFKIGSTRATAPETVLVTEIGGAGRVSSVSPIFYTTLEGDMCPRRLLFQHQSGGEYKVFVHFGDTGTEEWVTSEIREAALEISYKHLITYPVG